MAVIKTKGPIEINLSTLTSNTTCGSIKYNLMYWRLSHASTDRILKAYAWEGIRINLDLIKEFFYKAYYLVKLQKIIYCN